jgi:hypothetical protein
MFVSCALLTKTRNWNSGVIIASVKKLSISTKLCM